MFSKDFFAKKLNTLMQEKNLTKQSLSEKLGISRQAVSKIANGANMPTIDNLISIADYFNVSIDYLVGRNDHPQYEYYLQKSENNLLLAMPEPFVSLFKYAKAKGIKSEMLPSDEHFRLMHMFQEWKDLCIAQTETFDKMPAHREPYISSLHAEEKLSTWKQLFSSLYKASADGVEHNNPSANKAIDTIAKLQKIAHNLDHLLAFSPYALNESADCYLTGLPDRLIEHLYQTTQADVHHPDQLKKDQPN